MAYELIRESVRLEIPQVHVSELTGLLEAIEYAYNLIAVISSGEAPVDAKAALSVVDPHRRRSVRSMNNKLRSFISPDAQLQLASIEPGSVTAVLSGIAASVRILVQIFDPIYWQERSEGLRHQKVMYRIAERSALRKEAIESLHTLEEFLAFERRVRQMKQLNNDEKEILISEARKAVGTVIARTEGMGIAPAQLPPPR